MYIERVDVLPPEVLALVIGAWCWVLVLVLVTKGLALVLVLVPAMPCSTPPSRTTSPMWLASCCMAPKARTKCQVKATFWNYFKDTNSRL